MGQQVGGEGTRTPSPSFYRVSRPSPTTGRGGPILRSADGTLQACQPPGHWLARLLAASAAPLSPCFGDNRVNRSSSCAECLRMKID
jgi:hypothetical protein